MAARPLGVSVMPLENRRETILHIATTADRLGYAAIFLPETWAYDITVLLAEIAARTSRIRLGTGIVNVWGRSAATIAMAAATLHGVSGGRFILGLGASTPQLAEGLHDVPFASPVKQMRRVVTQVRALLRGERVPLAVATAARPLRLNLPPVPELPIYLAGLAPGSIRLAGELADGWFPFLLPRRSLRDDIEIMKEGTARGPEPRRAIEICTALPTSVARDRAEARAGAAWFLAYYLTTMGPFYPKMLSGRGFAREVEAIQGANPPRAATVVPAEAEELLDQLTLYGTPEEAHAQLDRWYDAGLSLPSLFLRPNLTPEEIDFTLEAFRP